MMPLVMVALSTMLLAFNFAVQQPQELAFLNKTAGDVVAANFYAYRQAVITYVYANPGASGTVADASLTFPLGYIRNSSWTNTVQTGTPYVYSTSVLAPAAMDAIARRGGRSMLIGYKNAAGQMTSLTGAASGFVLPAAMSALPQGVVVVIGQ
ncbi:MAG: type IV pilus biogenesis protein PilM [Sulfuritalea sp.]|nr:type IV pilus biogenesis protein PilM [Sulfuritalea sp.]